VEVNLPFPSRPGRQSGKKESRSLSAKAGTRSFATTCSGSLVADPEQSIAEFKRLCGQGDSRGWRFDWDKIHERS